MLVCDLYPKYKGRAVELFTSPAILENVKAQSKLTPASKELWYDVSCNYRETTIIRMFNYSLKYEKCIDDNK